MKIKILLFTLFVGSTFCTAQESGTISKAKLAEIERSIQSNTTDTLLLAVIEQEKAVSKKLNSRVEELTRTDETYNSLKNELKEIRAKKTDKLIAYSAEYKASYNDLQKNNADKSGIAEKQEMKEKELADKKAGIAKKQEVIEKEAANKKAGIVKKQEMKEKESADKKASATAGQKRKAEELAKLHAQKRAELEKKHNATRTSKSKKGN